MAARKPFLLRVSKEVLDELRAWAAQDMRSLNGQIEFLLREALQRRKKAELAEPTETLPLSQRILSSVEDKKEKG